MKKVRTGDLDIKKENIEILYTDIKNKKSNKISLKLGQFERNKFNSFGEVNDNNERLYYNEGNINISININFYLEFNNNNIYTVNLNINKCTTFYEIIKLAIKNFNKNEYKFVKNNKEVIVKLKNNPKKYYLKPSRKNNLPKDYYPPYDYDSNLLNIDRKNFSLLINDLDCITYNENKKIKRNNCSNCIII